MENQLDTLINALRKQIEREVRLRKLRDLNAPDSVIQTEEKSCQKSRTKIAALEKTLGKELVAEYRKKVYRIYLENRLKEKRAELKSVYCPYCRYMYFYPDGREIPDEVFDSLEHSCTLHSERPNQLIEAKVDGGKAECEEFEEHYNLNDEGNKKEIQILERILYAVT